MSTEPKDHWWRGEDSNLRRRSRQIYSLIPLATREPLHIGLFPMGNKPMVFYRENPRRIHDQYEKKN